jgi:DNA-binding NarL/FixJ family response regulator
MSVGEFVTNGCHEGKLSRPQAIRVVVADDHPIVRYGLRQLLTQRGEIDIVGESDVGPEVVGVVAHTQADVLILDLRMSDARSWSVLKTLQQIGSKARVIILTASEDRKQFVHALKLGCLGIILKQATAEQIATCIRKVHAGEVWVDPRIAVALDQLEPGASDRNGTSPERGNRNTLSRREREVLALVAQGYPNPRIAAKLFISAQTVKNHLHHLYEKTGVANRAELVILAIHSGVPVFEDR